MKNIFLVPVLFLISNYVFNQDKIGFVNSTEIFDSIERIKEINTESDELLSSFEEKLKLYSEQRLEAEELTYDSSYLQSLKKESEDKMNLLKNEVNLIAKKVVESIESVAKSNNYNLIIDSSDPQNLRVQYVDVNLLNDKSRNITDVIKKRVN